MYIVANITNNTISLSDLDVTIPPNQSRDLHQLNLSMKPEKSEHLKIAISKKYLKVIKRDMKIKHVDENVKSAKSQGMDEKSLAKIIREELKGLKSNVEPQKEVDQNDVLQQMLIMMQQMKDIVKGQQLSGVVKNEANDINYDDIDLEQLSKIHAKAVKKLTENVENSIDYEKETTKDTSLASRADELSDIL